MPDVDERHTLLFSATMPDNRQKLAKQFLRPEYLFIEVGIVGGACQGKYFKNLKEIDYVLNWVQF